MTNTAIQVTSICSLVTSFFGNICESILWVAPAGFSGLAGAFYLPCLVFQANLAQQVGKNFKVLDFRLNSVLQESYLLRETRSKAPYPTTKLQLVRLN